MEEMESPDSGIQKILAHKRLRLTDVKQLAQNPTIIEAFPANVLQHIISCNETHTQKLKKEIVTRNRPCSGDATVRHHLTGILDCVEVVSTKAREVLRKQEMQYQEQRMGHLQEIDSQMELIRQAVSGIKVSYTINTDETIRRSKDLLDHS